MAEGYLPGAVPHSSQQLFQAVAVAPVGSKTQARADASNTAPASRQLPMPTAGHPPCPVFREGWENCTDKPINSQAHWGADLKTAVVGKVKTPFPGSEKYCEFCYSMIVLHATCHRILLVSK